MLSSAKSTRWSSFSIRNVLGDQLMDETETGPTDANVRTRAAGDGVPALVESSTRIQTPPAGARTNLLPDVDAYKMSRLPFLGDKRWNNNIRFKSEFELLATDPKDAYPPSNHSIISSSDGRDSDEDLDADLVDVENLDEMYQHKRQPVMRDDEIAQKHRSAAESDGSKSDLQNERFRFLPGMAQPCNFTNYSVSISSYS